MTLKQIVAVAGMIIGLSLSVQAQDFSSAKWEQELTQAWKALSPKAQQELIDEQRAWIKWKDSLTSSDLEWALVDRVNFLRDYKIDPEAALDVARLRSRTEVEFGNGLTEHDAREQFNQAHNIH